MKYICLIGAAVTAVAAATLMSAPAFATPMSWTASGTCDDPGCSATVKIIGSSYTPATGTSSNGSDIFEIKITDNLVNPPSQGDLVSGILLSLSESFTSASLVSQSGELIDVTSNTGPYTTSPGPPTHWGVGTTTMNCPATGQCIALETAGDAAQGGTPIDMIIGQPDKNGNYSNANHGFTQGHFDPLILGYGIFFVDVMGLNGTLPPTISGVTIAFGTGPDYYKKAVPEPLTLSVFGVGVVCAAALRRRRKKA